MEKFWNGCTDLDNTYDQLNRLAEGVVISDPKLMRFSPGSKTVMTRYFNTLYHRYGLSLLRKIISSECTSRELLFHALENMSRADIAFVKCISTLSDHVLCMLMQLRNFCLESIIFKTVVERKRLQAKRNLGVIVKWLWPPLSPCVDTIFNICQFYALPFSATELRVLINGFIGKEGRDIGYRKVVLRRGGKSVI